MRAFELFEQKKVNDIVKNWRNRDAAEYAEKMIKAFGGPDEATDTLLMWRDIDSFKETIIKDESVPHDFPKNHRDYVYSTMHIEVPEQLMNVLAHVTGSIIVDGLKHEVTARCGTLWANAVTLGFVQDLVDNTIPNNSEKAKKEYGKRILSGKKSALPEWYDNEIKE